MKKKIFFATAGVCFILNSFFYNVVSDGKDYVGINAPLILYLPVIEDN